MIESIRKIAQKVVAPNETWRVQPSENEHDSTCLIVNEKKLDYNKLAVVRSSACGTLSSIIEECEILSYDRKKSSGQDA